MEQTSNNTKLNIGEKINQELVNNLDNTDGEVDNTTNSEINNEVPYVIENTENNVQLQHE